MRTLVMVDIQNDFMPGGPLAVPDGDKIVPVVNQIQKDFDLVIASQDWHPPDHISFASNHDGKAPFDIIEIEGMKQTLWPDHCVQGTRGAELHPDLETDRVEAIFRKGTDPGIDSYSAFFDNGHKKNTGLAGYLREKGVQDISFCGLAADICVYYTVRDALEAGFSATIVEDAVRPLDPDEYEKLREELVTGRVVLV